MAGSACCGHLLDDEASPGVGAGVGGAEGLDVVAPASLPGDVGQVEAVVDAEVHERRQLLLVDGVPEAQLGGDAVVEPVEDGQAVAALGGGGEAEQLDGGEVVEHLLVRRGGGVVELVDDHHVEVIGREVGQAAGVEALDRGEDVLEALRPGAADPLLAEGGVAQGVAEGGEALVEDLLAVGDEQQAGAGEPLAEASVVDGGHHGLAGAGGGHEEVAVVALLAGDVDLLEQPLLEGRRAQLDRAEDDERAVVGAAGAALLLVELVGVVGDEVAGLPVAVEHGLELVDDVGVAGGRGPDVPLQPGDLRLVGEVGGADVGGGEAGAPVEHPGLGVEAGAAEVVGDADLGAQVGELVEGPAARWSRCRWWSGPGAACRRSQWRRRLSSSGAMPLRRMKAMTTSMASADSISERSWLHRPGSPGALVSSVVSSSGMSGCSIGCGRAVGPALADGVEDLGRIDRELAAGRW